MLLLSGLSGPQGPQGGGWPTQCEKAEDYNAKASCFWSAVWQGVSRKGSGVHRNATTLCSSSPVPQIESTYVNHDACMPDCQALFEGQLGLYLAQQLL